MSCFLPFLCGEQPIVKSDDGDPEQKRMDQLSTVHCSEYRGAVHIVFTGLWRTISDRGKIAGKLFVHGRQFQPGGHFVLGSFVRFAFGSDNGSEFV